MTGPRTIATAFSGFGGFDVGAEVAGLRSIWGIEYDDAIAAVARDNGLPTLTVSVLDVDWTAMGAPWWYHASPPCPSFSVAKTDGGETEADLALADAVCASIRTLRPPFFSLENVRGYVGSESLRRIHQTLLDEGYQTTDGVLCAADYGVPQTRDRYILVASRVARPKLPAPTHAERPGPAGLFGDAPLPWVGWYEAVEDLLPTLPDSRLAPWQMARLPADLRETVLLMSNVSGFARAEVGQGLCPTSAPANTVPAVPCGGMPRAVLVDGQEGPTFRDGDCPAITVAASVYKGRPSAVLVSSNSVDGGGLALRRDDEPGVTVDTKAERTRAVLIHDTSTMEQRDGRSRAATVVAQLHPTRAVLVAGQNASSMVPMEAERPAGTVTALETIGQGPRARMARGEAPAVRVVQLSPRCLARFQSFPDSYRLPEKASLACKGIGNAVPPLLAQRIVEANL